MRKRILLASCLCVLAVTSCTIPDNKGQIWNIGVPDSSTVELALGPDRYKDFLANDFGFEDRYFLVGKSDVKKSFPYVLPGPADQWGGTWSTAGLRTHDVNILFGLENIPEEGEWSLIVDLADNSPHKPPLLKVLINNSQEEKIQLTSGGSDASITGDMSQAKPIHLSIPVKKGVLREGGNSITLSVLEGSWLLFDHVGLQGPSRVRLVNPEKAFVRSVL